MKKLSLYEKKRRPLYKEAVQVKVGIIADDLTGANATGVRLSENGLHPATYFHYNDLLEDENTDVIIIDTDSRYASEKVLEHRVGGALTKLKGWNEIYSK